MSRKGSRERATGPCFAESYRISMRVTVGGKLNEYELPRSYEMVQTQGIKRPMLRSLRLSAGSAARVLYFVPPRVIVVLTQRVSPLPRTAADARLGNALKLDRLSSVIWDGSCGKSPWLRIKAVRVVDSGNHLLTGGKGCIVAVPRLVEALKGIR